MNKMFKLLQLNRVHVKAWARQMSQSNGANAANGWKRKFEEENIEDADFSIKCIMARVLNVDFSTLKDYTNLQLTPDQSETFDKLCECRLSRMPIQYILGNWDFRSLNLRMIPPVFIPRPETEQLVELALKDLNPDECYEFLEIGCGSGAITCSILSEMPNSSMIALDFNRLACTLAEFNAKENGIEEGRLKVITHKVTDESVLPADIEAKQFDCIVSNPPYVKSADLLKLAPEIKLYEDLRALDGGPDGLKITITLCKIADQNLKSGGKMWLEVDGSQMDSIRNVLAKRHPERLKFVASHKDMYQRERFVEIAKR